MDHDGFKFSHVAMASPFEVFIAHDDKAYAGQAADAVFAEVDAVENSISRFKDNSDVAQINNAPAGKPIRVSIHTFECLRVAYQVFKDTGGAFDVTVTPLLSCWKNPDKTPRQPSDQEIAEAKARVGMDLLELDEKERTVTLKKNGVRVDFGGIGKGYAVERAAGILEDWDIDRALINAGDSSVYASDPPPGKEGWAVGVGGVGDEPKPRQVLQLRQKSLSGSGFYMQPRHIIDPRIGRPAESKLAAWSLCKSPTQADALSTAFIIMTPPEVEAYCKKYPDVSAMLILPDKQVLTYGKW